MTIRNLEDATIACQVLHDKGVDQVVVTSLLLEPGVIHILASHRKSPVNVFLVKMQSLSSTASGSGDMLAAAITAYQTFPYSAATLRDATWNALNLVQYHLTNGVLWKESSDYLFFPPTSENLKQLI